MNENIEKLINKEPVIIIGDNNPTTAVGRLIDFLRDTEYCEYPDELIEQVLANKQESIPLLLEIVEDFVQCPIVKNIHVCIDADMEAIVALYILAKFREQRAFPLLIQLCCRPAPWADIFWGDISTEHLNSLLASTFNGDLNALYAIASNQYLEQYVRNATLGAYVILYKYDKITREQVLNAFGRLFNELTYDCSYMPTGLATHCGKIGASELREQVTHLFDLDLIDENFVDRHEILKELEKPFDEMLGTLKNDCRRLDYIDDLKKQMGWLLRRRDENNRDNEFVPMVGRNAPCPCGSGKKYKKCCLVHS